MIYEGLLMKRKMVLKIKKDGLFSTLCRLFTLRPFKNNQTYKNMA